MSLSQKKHGTEKHKEQTQELWGRAKKYRRNRVSRSREEREERAQEAESESERPPEGKQRKNGGAPPPYISPSETT